MRSRSASWPPAVSRPTTRRGCRCLPMRPAARSSPLEMKRATLRGTVLIALNAIAPEVQRATPPFGQGYRSVGEHSDYFRKLRDRFEATYGALVAK